MAVIEYMINVDRPNGNAKVTHVIVNVGPGVVDKVRFKSNESDTAIQFVGASPFDANDPKAPQKNKSFKVGKGPTAEFEVRNVLSHAQRITFDCGHETAPGVFSPWGGAGDGVPAN